MPHHTHDSPHAAPISSRAAARGVHISAFLCAEHGTHEFAELVDRRGRVVHRMCVETGETDEEVYARGLALLNEFDRRPRPQL